MEYTNKNLKNFKINNILASYMLSKNKFPKFSKIPCITKIKIQIPIKEKKIKLSCYITGIFFLMFGTVPKIKKNNKNFEIELNFYKNLIDFILPFSLFFFSIKNERRLKMLKANKIIFSFKIKNLLNFYSIYNLYFHLLQNHPIFDLLLILKTNIINNVKLNTMLTDSFINLYEL